VHASGQTRPAAEKREHGLHPAVARDGWCAPCGVGVVQTAVGDGASAKLHARRRLVRVYGRGWGLEIGG
jgi:hypothetical protein